MWSGKDLRPSLRYTTAQLARILPLGKLCLYGCDPALASLNMSALRVESGTLRITVSLLLPQPLLLIYTLLSPIPRTFSLVY